MKVTLKVYDELGRKVDGQDAGTYICRLVATGANGETVTKTINLLQVK